MLVASTLFSCEKPVIDGPIVCAAANIPEGETATLTGKWNIVTDSTYVAIDFYNNHMYYQGQTGDYFDFRNDGKLYTKEGARLDTTSYQLTSDTTILIPSFGISSNGATAVSFITKLPANNIVIKSSKFTAVGGFIGRKVNLSR
ncbi:MAG: hypothetical protein EOP44_04135 [Sphingobacteriaceae bacterium]|nr:MAG: hypothetical protein EOP44_04135 [Sphingobacteriaceae bacterium]